MSQSTHEIIVPAHAAALKEVRNTFREVVQSWAPDCAEMLILALDECCSNVVKYRCKNLGDGNIRVRAEHHPGLIRFRIGDFCTKKDVEKIRPRDLDDVKPGGLGTHFVKEIMSRISYEADPNHPEAMTLVLEKDLP